VNDEVDVLQLLAMFVACVVFAALYWWLYV